MTLLSLAALPVAAAWWKTDPPGRSASAAAPAHAGAAGPGPSQARRRDGRGGSRPGPHFESRRLVLVSVRVAARAAAAGLLLLSHVLRHGDRDGGTCQWAPGAAAAAAERPRRGP